MTSSTDDPIAGLSRSYVDPGDLNEALRRYEPWCLRVAMRVTQDHHHAQDAVQEAFLAFASAPSRFDATRGTVGSWLAMLTHRRAVDIVRREQSRPKPTPSTSTPHPQALLDPETQAAQSLQSEQVHHLLRTLSPANRQVIYMTYYLGYTQTQIANATGTPLGTVKSRGRTALRQLRSTITAASPDGTARAYPLALAG